MKFKILIIIVILSEIISQTILSGANRLKVVKVSSETKLYRGMIYDFKVEALNNDNSVDTNCYKNIEISSSLVDDTFIIFKDYYEENSSKNKFKKTPTIGYLVKGVFSFCIICTKPDTIRINVKDLGAIKLKEYSTNITFNDYTITSNKVVINEVMYKYIYNKWGERQWIELYNKSERNINLQNWEVQRISVSPTHATNTVTLPSFFIKAHSFFVLAQNASFFANDFPSLSVDLYSPILPSTTFLSTTRAILLIKDNNGNVVDSIFYNNDDYDLDYMQSLERVNPDFPSYDENNWAGCISTEGIDRGVKGTPGEANSVYKESENNSDIEIKASISLDKKVYDVSSSSLFNINFSINLPVKVDVKIFDSRGNEVRRIKNEYQIGQGNITFKFDGYNSEGKKLTTGLYFIYITYINDKTGHYGKVIKPFIISNGKF